MRTAARFAFVFAFAACTTNGSLPASPAGVDPESITVTSRAFSSGEPIPIDSTCDGKNTPPDVTWSSPPEATKSLVLTLDDLEAPAGKGTHWLIEDINPEARLLSAGGDPGKIGGKLLANDRGEAAYRGPCPAHHEGHHYAFRIIALDRTLGLPENADRERVNARMEGHVLGAGALVGTASR